MSNPMRVLINGSRGRMGQALVQCSKDFDSLSVGAEVDTSDDFIGALQNCEAVIDFSHHAIIESVLTACVASHKTLVIGTTGHSDAQIAAIHAAGKQIPIVFAPNYSVGVNTLFWLTRKATEILGMSFDLEVVEMHHRMKKTLPAAPPSASPKSSLKCARFLTRMTPGTDATVSWASARKTKSACTLCAVETS